MAVAEGRGGPTGATLAAAGCRLAAPQSSIRTLTSSPFLKRVVQPTYVFPFDMNKKDTYFLMTVPSTGAFLIIVSFAANEDPDKDVTIHITDTVTETMWDPPRPWIFDPLVVSVRNGFTTPSIVAQPKIE